MNPHLQQLSDWILASAAKAQALYVPVSGGTDSALVFWLCSQAYPAKTVAVHAGKDLRERAWFESVGKVEFVDVPGEHTEREEMRWARFLARARDRSAWLVGSRNRTEDLLGTYSLSSRTATYLPLVGVWKSDVLKLCAEIGVPEGVIASSLRADPDCGRPDELAAISYQAIEAFLRTRIGEAPRADDPALSPEQVEYLEKIFTQNAFKPGLPTRGPVLL